MELLLRVHVVARATIEDVAVEIDAESPLSRLAEALAEALALPDGASRDLVSAATGAGLDPDAPVGASGIVSGDEVVLGGAPSPTPPAPVPIRAVSVDVLGGPDSGHSAVLGRGTWILGRDAEADLTFGDASVSRRHLRVVVGADWTVTVSPEDDPQNGVLVNDVVADGPTVVAPDDVIALGSTRIAMREFVRAEVAATDRLGQIEFHRTPHRPHPVRERELEPFGPVPTRPEPRRFQVLSVLAPLAAGLVLYAFSRQVQFLAIIAISPLAMVGNWVEDRRSGRHRFTHALARFHAGLDERAAEIAAALAAERVERVRAAPDLADLARRAELRTIDLWPRSRATADFLTVRIGLGQLPSRVSAPLATGGDDDLRELAEERIAGHDSLTDVPVTVPLAHDGVVAAHGPPEVVDDVAAAALVQATCLHSPEDLVVAAALRPDRPVASWAKWLPHVRSVTTPLAGAHVATEVEPAQRLLRELIAVAELRIAETDNRTDRRWPWLLVLLDGDLGFDATLTSRLLERCPAAGISVLWLATSEAQVPRQATSIVDCGPPAEPGFARLWHTDPDRSEVTVELGRVHPDVADRVARSLAAVRDASVATATTAIPRTVPLLSVLGTERPDAEWVLRRWRSATGYGLAHPVGAGPDGVFRLDLVADGPHALIGGTSGAGKSELLQSMVASLITCHPPHRLNFLFVDYKGGASSTVFRDVPHTVGYVTNLDATLSLRALTSLRAELDRRMRLMEGRAKDLAEMLERHPEEAPASLVIVVDEFATLVKEIPDFVAGIVDIAQRGRSLGIHLVLATQRPSGSVNDNILANTNLRLSLRMLDTAESNAVIGSPDAADIPVPLRGRGFARLGPRELVPFQSAFAGAPLAADADDGVVEVRAFTATGRGPSFRSVSDRDADGGGSVDVLAADGAARTHLDAVLDAVIAAADRAGETSSRPPWREMLADHVALDDLTEDPRAQVPAGQAGRTVLLGLVDDPEAQDQYPGLVDLEEGGGLLVFGSGGSGKTTLLRTAVVSALRAAEPGELAVFAIDFASRSLRGIAALPEVGAVAGGDDLEAVTRVIALLRDELTRRQSVLAEHRAETLSAYRTAGSPGGALPRVLLVVDGYANLVATMNGGGYGAALDQWLDTLHRVVVDGRQVGIHTILAAERRAGVPAVIQSAVANRIVLRQSDPNSYAELGLPMAQATSLDLRPGRGLWLDRELVQIACISRDGDGAAQAAAVDAMAERRHDRRAPITTDPLPAIVAVADLPPPTEGLVPIGIRDLTLDPVALDVAHSHVLISGLPRSGRTGAAAVLADGLAELGHEVWMVGRGSSPLRHGADLHRSAFGKAAAIQPVLAELAEVLADAPTALPRILVADDLDDIDDPTLNPVWDALAAADGLRVVATIENRSFSGFSMNTLLNEVRGARRILVLRPDDLLELFQQTGVKAPVRPGTAMPPGRGVLLADRQPTVVQIAAPSWA